MKVALIGASGFVGTAVLTELLNRGHEVTAIVRNPSRVQGASEKLNVKQVNVESAEDLALAVTGQDAVISAYNAGWTNPNIYEDFLSNSKSIQAAVKSSGVKRLIVVGGGGSLFVAPKVQVVDTPQFPEEWKAGALAARDYLNFIQDEKELDWTFLSPALEMHQGTSGVRTGKYRLGLDNPVVDESGRSVISVEDTALAIVDELEDPKHIKKRFTIAY
jgi:uncharacterized protein